MGSQISQLIQWKDNPKKALAESANLTGILSDQTGKKPPQLKPKRNETPTLILYFYKSNLATSWTVPTLQNHLLVH